MTDNLSFQCKEYVIVLLKGAVKHSSGARFIALNERDHRLYPELAPYTHIVLRSERSCVNLYNHEEWSNFVVEMREAEQARVDDTVRLEFCIQYGAVPVPYSNGGFSMEFHVEGQPLHAYGIEARQTIDLAREAVRKYLESE